MKYFSVNTVVKAYMDFQGSMSNKSWGFLSILKQVPNMIKAGVTYEIDCNALSTYLEETFCISDDKKQYVSGTSPWYVMFSNKWFEFFQSQGNTIPNIYDIIAWAYRRESFPDDITNIQLLAKFAKDFNIEQDILNKAFSTIQKTLEFADHPYKESQLQSAFATSGITMSDKNLTAIKTTVKAAPGELSRGPFIQPLYAALDTTDYLLISQSNFSELYDLDSDVSDVIQLPKNLPLQQIYYGAPGTGKSHTINEQTEGESVIRTTFHPDSDYSTFVGAYKPTMGLLPICDELGQPMKIGSTVLHKEQIIYEFVDQAFLQAYVKAWKNLVLNEGKKQYLVIEEINRGNCAQIFGDLFQLLDRNEYGFSDYPIQADKDMRKFLKKAFARQDEPDKQIFLQDEDKKRINQQYKSGDDVVNKVLSGEILLLPNNLYIWATMNTSDQSLFPIDSAFKRRWDWQYMPIGKGFDANGREIKWAIEGATKKYDWWSFLEKINAQIGEATQSEDKKLGFFFCKGTDGVISAEKFVGKVIFYLWNDVFKNNGFEGPIFKDVDGTELSFGKFYKSDAKGNAIVQKDRVELFLNNLGVEVAGNNETSENENEILEFDENGNETFESSKSYDRSKYSVNGEGEYGKGKVVYESIKLYIANNPQKDAKEIVNDWLSMGVAVPNFVETKDMFDARTSGLRDPRVNSRANIATLENGEIIYVSNQYNIERISDFISKINSKNWGITISKV